jgi:hypothetical protein
MKATTDSIGEYKLTDSVHVRVIPCPTGDSIADLQEMRGALADALQAVEVVRFDDLYADWCRGNNNIAFSSATHRILAILHTHPYSPKAGDYVAYCTKLAVDPATGYSIPVQPPDSVPFGFVGAGGSGADWDLLNALNQQLQASGLPQVDEFIIDLDYVNRLNHGQQPSYTPMDYKACPNWLK